MTQASPGVNIVRGLGSGTLSTVQTLGRMGIFLAKALFFIFIPPLKVRRTLRRIRFIGFESILLIVLAGGFMGMVLGFQGFYSLTRVGSTAFLGPMVALSLLKELGPVITGLIITGRAGSAVTAEIGIMRIGEEVDALELMGLNPFQYLVVPTFLAALICVPLLTAIFNVVGILGGFLVGVKLLGVGAGTYFGEMVTYVSSADVLSGVYKSLCFGGIIAWVCTFKGYYAGFGPEGVSKATTQAVVLASILVLVSDYFLTTILL